MERVMATYPVLDAITPLPEAVVLEIQYLKSSMDILDKLANEKRAFIVT